MAASLSVSVIDGAPGNILSIPGAGLIPGAGASVTLSGQGVTAAPNLTASTITIANPTFSTTAVSFTVPDGVTNGTLTVTAGDTTVATCALRAKSQYVQASEFNASGSGWDTSSFATGELDAILRRASARVDTFMGHSLRNLQVVEQHKYRAPRNDQPPRLFPWRVRGRRCPVISLDQLTFVSAFDLVTTFQPSDSYVNASEGYIEILAYAVGNFALLGELQVIGYSANVFEISYTSGYPYVGYPSEVMDATNMVASVIMDERNTKQLGLGGLKSIGKDLPVANSDFSIPYEAKMLLRPYTNFSVS